MSKSILKPYGAPNYKTQIKEKPNYEVHDTK